LVASYQGGLQVVDVSNPAAPARVGQYNSGGYAEGVAVLGNSVYVADGNLGLAILRLPKELPSLQISSVAGEVTVNWEVSTTTEFTLEVCNSLPAISWSPLTNSVVSSGNLRSLVTTPGEAISFYRLRGN
jgi:hypothetical protein